MLDLVGKGCIGLCAGVWLTLVLMVDGFAAPPVVTAYDVRGLTAGGVTKVTVSGTSLLPNPRLMSSLGTLKQRVLEGSTSERVSIEVDTPSMDACFANVWFVSDGGVAARAVFAIDSLAQRPLSAGVEGVPVAVHGVLSGAQIAETKFVAKAGQRLILEVEAQRMDSRLRPVIRVHGPDGSLCGWSVPTNLLKGDARLEFVAQRDGEHRVEVRDLQYAAVNGSPFRLKLGDWIPADAAYPPMIQVGSETQVELVAASGAVGKGTVSKGVEGRAVAVASSQGGKVNSAGVGVWLSPLPQTVEFREGDAVQVIERLPASVNGRISKPLEVDRYSFPVEPESEVLLELLADALGSPVDGEVEVLDEKGTRIAVNDDGPVGPDARLLFKVPKGVERVIASVRDVTGQGGPLHMYCLQIKKRQSDNDGQVTLRMVEDGVTVPFGGPAVLRVEALREGFDGEIPLTVRGSEGYQTEGLSIPARAGGILTTIRSGGRVDPAILRVQGKVGERTEVVRVDAGTGSRLPAWLESGVAVSASVEDAFPFKVVWDVDPATKRMPLAGKMSVKVRCMRPVGHDGPVRLTLLTSQSRQVDAKGAVQALKMLREEKAVLIEEDKKAQAAYDAVAAAEKVLQAAQKAVDGASTKGEVPDALTKALVMAEMKRDTAVAESVKAAEGAKNEAEIVLLVPPDLVEIPHQISFKAELLRRDRKTVDALAYLPIATVPVINPVGIRVPSEFSVSVDPKKGGQLEIVGEVERREDGKGDVTVSLTGLPAGISAAPVTVKATESRFALKLQLAASVKPGEFASLRLSATARPYGPPQVKTEDLPITLKVVGAEATTEKKSG